MDALRRGVDVVVGTPGRIMDLLERKRLIGDKVGEVLGWRCVSGASGCCVVVACSGVGSELCIAVG